MDSLSGSRNFGQIHHLKALCVGQDAGLSRNIVENDHEFRSDPGRGEGLVHCVLFDPSLTLDPAISDCWSDSFVFQMIEKR